MLTQGAAMMPPQAGYPAAAYPGAQYPGAPGMMPGYGMPM